MVGRNDIVFSGYKSHRTTEHREKGEETRKKKAMNGRGKKNCGAKLGELD